MPRIPRGQQAGFVYHVIDRGNGRATIFHKAQDYFGLRLFKTFQEPALSSIEGFNRCAYQNEAGSNRSSRSTASLRSSRIGFCTFKQLEPPIRFELLERFERLERVLS